MIKYNELVGKPEYWTTIMQLDLFSHVEKYMKEDGVSRTELAKRLGVTKGYISQVLNGDYDHRLSKFVELAMAVGVVPQVTYIPKERVFQQNVSAKQMIVKVQQVEEENRTNYQREWSAVDAAKLNKEQFTKTSVLKLNAGKAA